MRTQQSNTFSAAKPEEVKATIQENKTQSTPDKPKDSKWSDLELFEKGSYSKAQIASLNSAGILTFNREFYIKNKEFLYDKTHIKKYFSKSNFSVIIEFFTSDKTDDASARFNVNNYKSISIKHLLKHHGFDLEQSKGKYPVEIIDIDNIGKCVLICIKKDNVDLT